MVCVLRLVFYGAPFWRIEGGGPSVLYQPRDVTRGPYAAPCARPQLDNQPRVRALAVPGLDKGGPWSGEVPIRCSGVLTRVEFNRPSGLRWNIS